MKKITLVIPDGYDQVISVTAIGVTIAKYCPNCGAKMESDNNDS